MLRWLNSWKRCALVAAIPLSLAGGMMLVPLMHSADPPVVQAKPEVIPVTYIGELADAPESARIGIVVEGDHLVAYACSADDDFNNTNCRWFKGAFDKDSVSMTVDEITLAVTRQDGKLVGSLKKAKEFKFTATPIAGDANAGLFRAEDVIDGQKILIGWVVDEKGTIVGSGGVAGKKVNTLQPPKGNDPLAGRVGDNKLPATKVNSATGQANAKPGQKLTKEAIAEIRADAQAAAQAAGGNPVLAMSLNVMRRFLAGKQPETEMERKAFAKLRTINRQTLEKYVDEWNRAPLAFRTAALGNSAQSVSIDKGLDAATARKMLAANRAFQQALAATPSTPDQGTIKGVTIPRITCVDETNPEIIGSDEVFAIHTVMVGTQATVTKTTAVLTGFEDGIVKDFAPGDATVFPASAQQATQAGAEVFIVTVLFEDDRGDVRAFLDLIKPLIELGAELVVDALNGDKKLSAAQKAGIRLAVDAAITQGLTLIDSLLVQPLGTDSIVVKPNGTIVGENGAAKSKMTFQKIRNGDLKYKYELSNFGVQR